MVLGGLPATRGGGTGRPRPSTTDRAVADAQALKAELGDEPAGQYPAGTIQGSVVK